MADNEEEERKFRALIVENIPYRSKTSFILGSVALIGGIFSMFIISIAVQKSVFKVKSVISFKDSGTLTL